MLRTKKRKAAGEAAQRQGQAGACATVQEKDVGSRPLRDPVNHEGSRPLREPVNHEGSRPLREPVIQVYNREIDEYLRRRYSSS